MLFKMGSSQPDRSLGEGTFLPAWMKGRGDSSRFDFTDSTFSPPLADDSFLYIPYPKSRPAASENPSTESGFKSLNEVFGVNKNDSSTTGTNKIVQNAAGTELKHSLSCQSFLQSTEKVQEPKVILANRPTKPAGHDFVTPEAGSQAPKSLVDKIMSSKLGKSISADPPQRDPQDSAIAKVSKSLPASPMTSPINTPDSSPKARRRVYGNRFFTGVFVPDQTRQPNSWLLGILGHPREVVGTKIEEEEDDDELSQEPQNSRNLNRKKSISSQNLTYVGKVDEIQEQQQQTPSKTSTLKSTIAAQFTALQAKPSELREMNFWSPTSM